MKPRLMGVTFQKQPLPQNFQCLFCNDEKAVTVKLDRKAGVGSLSCKLCGQNFQVCTPFPSLTFTAIMLITNTVQHQLCATLSPSRQAH